MPRALADMQRRTLTLDTGKRSIDIPVDAAGHVRRVAVLDQRAVTRAAGDDSPIGFVGHAAVFNKRTWIGSKRWGYWESVEPGAFTKTIGEADVRFLHNHNPDLILARNIAGTLRLAEDETGLAADADMAPTTYAKDLAISLERGDITQMSFAFDYVTYEWTVAEDGNEWLRLRELALWDVSTVTYPAYTETDAALRMDLLAAARAAGLDEPMVGAIARRLAEPDPDLIAALRNLARGTTSTPPAPAETTRDDSAPAPATRDHSQPAETTGDTTIDARDIDRDRRFADIGIAERAHLMKG
jgi:HK97 family phage prohead protease